MSRSYWDFVLAMAYGTSTLGPAIDVWQTVRGQTPQRLVAAHTSLTELAGETGGLTLTGLGLAVTAWLWIPTDDSVGAWVALGGTYGLLAGLWVWSVRRLAPQPWAPGFGDGLTTLSVYTRRGIVFAASAVFILGLSGIQMWASRLVWWIFG
ncbi:hypothetical protein AB0K43_30015 [Kitasatospora sp. NPDC049258]|uniref:hypothetical protein n=1 Tax=Kitasatospora sp. NPDC049258 TaxID=3155394 RepID=UPI003425455B